MVFYTMDCGSRLALKGEILGIRSVIAKHMLFWYFIFKSLLR
jgi:hypothetical protein